MDCMTRARTDCAPERNGGDFRAFDLFSIVADRIRRRE